MFYGSKRLWWTCAFKNAEADDRINSIAEKQLSSEFKRKIKWSVYLFTEWRSINDKKQEKKVQIQIKFGEHKQHHLWW